MEFEITAANGQLEIGETAMELLKQYQLADLQMAKVKMQMDKFKESVLKAMEANGIKKFENDELAITYVAPTVRNTVDTKALKEQGLYDIFVKTSNVKASVKIAFKDE